MDTPLEESNLAGIGSDEDKALRAYAASTEVHWEGAGEEVGIQIWRVENVRDEDDVPHFGIKPWPTERYGEFHRGDSYIVLQTAEDDEGDRIFDIYFWIGSHSSQDEYGVAAYKANELDDLLGDAPVQHREVEGLESVRFMKCFPEGVHYLEGGVESGFRKVDQEQDVFDLPDRLLHIRRVGTPTRAFRIIQVPMSTSSLNAGDAFMLDTGTEIYTWYGPDCSPFERNHCATLAQNSAGNRFGHCTVTTDVGDDLDAFWDLLEGGREEIKPAEDVADEDVGEKLALYHLKQAGGVMKVDIVPAVRSNLVSEDVCVLDAGKKVYVWIGKNSEKDERFQSMILVERFLKANHRSQTTSVEKVLEGRERRTPGFFQTLQ